MYKLMLPQGNSHRPAATLLLAVGSLMLMGFAGYLASQPSPEALSAIAEPPVSETVTVGWPEQGWWTAYCELSSLDGGPSSILRLAPFNARAPLADALSGMAQSQSPFSQASLCQPQ